MQHTSFDPFISGEFISSERTSPGVDGATSSYSGSGQLEMPSNVYLIDETGPKSDARVTPSARHGQSTRGADNAELNALLCTNSGPSNSAASLIASHLPHSVDLAGASPAMPAPAMLPSLMASANLPPPALPPPMVPLQSILPTVMPPPATPPPITPPPAMPPAAIPPPTMPPPTMPPPTMPPPTMPPPTMPPPTMPPPTMPSPSDSVPFASSACAQLTTLSRAEPNVQTSLATGIAACARRGVDACGGADVAVEGAAQASFPRSSSVSEGGGVTHMYHERQLSALCGVHALNNLLQGPYYGAGDLAEIAARLDAREAELLSGSNASETRGNSFVSATPRGFSHHVDADSGDFSIEVLQAALAPRGLHLINWENVSVVVDVAASPHDEAGFLCHSASHWFALRSLAGLWFNCDSRLPRPRLISDAHLSDFLIGLRQSAHTVFIVRPLDAGCESGDAGAHSAGVARVDGGALAHPEPPAGGAAAAAGAEACAGVAACTGQAPVNVLSKAKAAGAALLPLPRADDASVGAGREDVWHPIEYLLLQTGDEPLEVCGGGMSAEEEAAAAVQAVAVVCQAEEDGDLAAHLMAEEIVAAEEERALVETRERERREKARVENGAKGAGASRSDGSKPGYFTMLGAKIDGVGETVASWFGPRTEADAQEAAAQTAAASTAASTAAGVPAGTGAATASASAAPGVHAGPSSAAPAPSQPPLSALMKWFGRRPADADDTSYASGAAAGTAAGGGHYFSLDEIRMAMPVPRSVPIAHALNAPTDVVDADMAASREEAVAAARAAAHEAARAAACAKQRADGGASTYAAQHSSQRAPLNTMDAAASTRPSFPPRPFDPFPQALYDLPPIGTAAPTTNSRVPALPADAPTAQPTAIHAHNALPPASIPAGAQPLATPPSTHLPPRTAAAGQHIAAPFVDDPD